MDKATEKYINYCRLYLGDDIATTDEKIDEAINQFAWMFENQNVNKEEVKKHLLTLYTLPVAPYKTLVDTNNPGSGWLSANSYSRQDKIAWKFWNRYITYLREKEKYQPGVIHQLDRLTNEILDNLYDPTLEGYEISKKGLVVGQVQSGKTSNFTGLVCKAVDSGFNVIIVFAGILDDLRTQTQSRLEKCFLGFTTKDIEKINESKIGVGLIDPSPIAHAFTTIVSDFKEATVNALGTNFQTNEPILFVVKKNGRILENMRKWLSKRDCNGKSVLFIDDEADNASVNTSKDKTKASTINKKIRTILNLFKRNAYVGYTATPYANIFIDRENQEDLFPRHFIVNLPTPAAYLSPEKVFGLDSEDEQPLPIVNIIKDYKEFVPDKHKKDETGTLEYANIPESLKYAIRCFIIACAIRNARGQGKKHNSMLIHLSRFQIWQNIIKDLIERCFKFYKNEILSDDADMFAQLKLDFEKGFICKEDNQTLEYKSFVQTTEDVINSDYKVLKNGVTPVSWGEVKKYLYRVVEKIEIKALNGASTDVLAYEDNQEDGYYVIAVGGDKLSRGLTLDGLTISYFLRASKMYDTLMQMGRWFGYRHGYVDVCRLFVSEEINNWFKAITIANNELREEFDYLWESKGSPQQYALKVRTSPGLLITSPLKMFSTKDVQISWASTLVETYSLVRSKEAIRHNYDLTSKFIKNLGQRHLNDGADDPRGFLWTDVPVNAICDYIGSFNIADTSRIKLDLEKMVDYIKTCNSEYGELNSWRVLVRNNKEKMFGAHTADSGQSEYYFNAPNIPRGICTNRTRVNIPDQDDNVYNLRNYHLISGPNDEFIDFYILGEESLYLKGAITETRDIKKRQHEENPNVKEWDKDYPSPVLVRQQYRPADKPFLIIYPLNPEKANIYRDGILKEGVEQYKANELPFIAFAIVFPNSQNSRGFKYKVNEVKELIESELNFENENDNEYADE